MSEEGESKRENGNSVPVGDLLGREIERRLEQQRREGWTKRAVVFGIAALLWVLADLWSRGALDLVEAARSYVVIFIAYDTVRVVFNVLFPGQSADDRVRFVPILRVVGDGSQAIVVFVELGIVLGALVVGADGWLWVSAAIGVLTYGFQLIAGLGMFYVLVGPWASQVGIVPRVEALVSHADYGKVIKAIPIGLQLMIVAVGVTYAVWLLPLPQGSALAEVRFAAISFGLVYLIRLLVNAVRSDPLLKRLERLERRYAVGDIDVTSLRDELELTLLGRDSERIVRDQVEVMMEYATQLDDQKRKLQKAYDHVEALGKAVIDDKECDVPRVKSKLDRAREHLRVWEKSYNTIDDLKQSAQRAKTLARIGSAFDPERRGLLLNWVERIQEYADGHVEAWTHNCEVEEGVRRRIYRCKSTLPDGESQDMEENNSSNPG